MASTEELLTEALDNDGVIADAAPEPSGAPDAAPDVAPEAVAPAVDAAPAQEPDFEPVIPPASLTAEEKAQWKAWNKDVQRYIARREKERDSGLTRKMMELSQKGRYYDSFRKTVEPHLEHLQRAGVDPHVAYNRMLAWHNAMQQNPQQAAVQFLRSYGLTPNHLGQAPQGGQPAPQMHQPQVPPEVMQRLQRAEGILHRYQQTEVQRMYESADSEAKAWLDEKNEKGDLLRPYAKELQDEMAPVVAALKAASPKAQNASILNKAYRAVLDDHPEITEAIEKQKEAKAKAAQIAASNAAARRARGAVVSVNGAPDGQPGRVTPKGTENVLTALMDGTLERA